MAGSPTCPFAADGEPIYLSTEARGLAKKCNGSQFALKEEKSLPPLSVANCNKLNGIFARLLLTLHLIETPIGRTDLLAVVSGATAKRAPDLMVKYFIPQALHLYGRSW